MKYIFSYIAVTFYLVSEAEKQDIKEKKNNKKTDRQTKINKENKNL
jgi:hypothetical protein